MATKKLSNESLEKALTESAWETLSSEFQWTEQMLEKHKNTVDWEKISGNSRILWTPSMLERFKQLIDWNMLSRTECKSILTEDCLSRFKDYWDWSELSENSDLILTYELIDKFIDNWNWEKLIDRWPYSNNTIYSFGFLERYYNKIPLSNIQGTRLWRALEEERVEALILEIIASDEEFVC